MRLFSSYRNRTRLRKVLVTLVTVLLVIAAVSIAVISYLGRYIVYDQDGAHLRLDAGTAAASDTADTASEITPEITYLSKDDEDAIGSARKITGYYITGEMLQDVDALRAALSGKEYYALLFDMKDVYGNFYYASTLSEAHSADSVNTQAVASYLDELRRAGVYLIARIPAFADQRYCLNHTDLGLPLSSGALWADDQNCYWMDPGNASVISYLESICSELQALGFREVVLDGFHFPATDAIVYDESEQSREDVLVSAVHTLQTDMGALELHISFGIPTAQAFPTLITDGRLYLTLDDGSEVSAAANMQAQAVATPATQLVFLTASRDTRFDDYGSLAPAIDDSAAPTE